MNNTLPPPKISLYEDQIIAVNDTDRLLNKHRVVATILPTGVGKSVVKAFYSRRYYEKKELTLIFAHRDVLLEQVSDKCCLMNVPHSFICSNKTRKNITNKNLENYGDSYWDENSHVIIVSVPTFLARIKSGVISQQFCYSVKHWLIDEGHHLLKSNLFTECNGDVDLIFEHLINARLTKEKIKVGNQWGLCTEVLKNATGQPFTATPKRGDKKDLGSLCDGHFDAMSVTTTTFDQIKKGRLSPYEVYVVNNIDVSGISHNKDGDLNNKQLYTRTKDADITGDAVVEYKRHLNGKPVITFCVNIEHAKEVAKAFNDAGIPSRHVDSTTPDGVRQQAINDLRTGRILNLVNVDLFGEGFDAPAVAGVIMMRRTDSYSLFKQQFGRMLRVADGKYVGILIDMVGNVNHFMIEYGLTAPHDDPVWFINKEKVALNNNNNDDNGDDDMPESIQCGNNNCKAYGLNVTTDKQISLYVNTGLLFINGVCPKCGWKESTEEKQERKINLKYKKGDLVKLDISIVDELIEQRNKALMSMSDFANTVDHTSFANAAKVRFARRQHALNVLRFKIQKWCEYTALKTSQSVPFVQADFELTFGVNIFKAQTGTATEMEQLAGSIDKELITSSIL